MQSLSFIFAALLILVSGIFWIYAFIILYHLIRFGIGRLPKQLSVITLTGSIVLFTWLLLAYSSISLL